MVYIRSSKPSKTTICCRKRSLRKSPNQHSLSIHYCHKCRLLIQEVATTAKLQNMIPQSKHPTIKKKLIGHEDRTHHQLGEEWAKEQKKKEK